LLETAMLNRDILWTIPELNQHSVWAIDILYKYPNLNKDYVRAILEQEIGKVFLEVLEDAGVFKRNKEGMDAFLRFVHNV